MRDIGYSKPLLRIAPADPLACLGQGRVRQADDVTDGKSRRDVDLDAHQLAAQAVDYRGDQGCQHGRTLGGGDLPGGYARLIARLRPCATSLPDSGVVDGDQAPTEAVSRWNSGSSAGSAPC